MDVRQITDDYAVSPQIMPEDMIELARLGFRTVINNRPDGEEDDQPSHETLAAAAQEAGLTYHFVPMVPGQLNMDLIAQLDELRKSTAQPIFAFCRSGTRSVTLWALSEKGKQPARKILEAAERAGYDLKPISPMLGATYK